MPFVTVRMRTHKGEAEGLALVDSGADRTILPAELMEALGVPWDSMQSAVAEGVGAGGSFSTRAATCTVTFRDWEVCAEVLVAQPGQLPGPLLGRMDFFQQFTVRFNWHRDPPTMDIDPAASPPPRKGRAKR